MNTSPRIALVTGAGSGIGRASAIALAGVGYTVVLAGRRKALLEEAAREAGPSALAVESDIRNPASVTALFAMVKARFGRLDVLFNNAGVNLPAAPLEAVSFEQWRTVMDTNITGTFLCTQEAFKLMKAQTPRGGRIINNGSLSAITPRPEMAPYAASKHAISGLTKSASLEGREYDIACGQIDIGNAATARVGMETTFDMLQPDGTRRKEATFDVGHVADLVVYMANLPLDTNVQFVSVMARKAPFIGRG